jgi:hypothetical protein
MLVQRFHPTIAKVRFEHVRDALGIGTARPRLSWIVTTESPGWYQAAYEIRSHGPDGYLLEQTGRVVSGESVLVPWPFAPLRSREHLTVQVRVFGADGQPSEWSSPASVEAGLLHSTDWTARFVTPDWDEDTNLPQPCPLLRREFDVRPGVMRARLYVTALGVYEAQLNGAIVGDHVLAPGWTSYHHRLCYQTFDVTKLLREGRNAVGAILGDGWYRGRLGSHGGRRNIYGDRLALLAQLEIEYKDGSTGQIITDASWRAVTGPILASDIYDGEIYDARLERLGWSEAGYDDRDWLGVRLLDCDLATLVAPSGPPRRRTELVAPAAILTSPSGRTIVDFGQNLVGRLRLKVQGAAGQTISLRHAEVLEGGELCTRPLRFAQATDQYTLCGDGIETWEPRFTFHGFRYAEVAGWPGALQADELCAVVCHSGMERTGWFKCSDPAVIVPWVLYQRYGDVGILAEQFESMRAWVDLIAGIAGAGWLWEKGIQYGDWLDPEAPPDRPWDARTDPCVVATAYSAHSAELVGQAAGVLGLAADQARYLALAAEIRDAFAREYVTPAGRLISDTATAYALALEFALLPNANQRRHAGRRLAALVRGNGYHISTGFVGTPLVCDALCNAGEYEAAYRLLMQRECPSWLYPITMGATTVWERWDSVLPDGSVNPGEMTSFNHDALGAVADWLHRTVGGLAPATPGWRHIAIQEYLDGRAADWMEQVGDAQYQG